MKKLDIKQMQPNVSLGDLVEFETTFNITLPENYKSFLLKINGGLVKTEESEIASFLPLKYGKTNIELVIDTHQITEQNISEKYLPIALDWSSNPITINLNDGDDYGKIVIFELDFEGDGHIIANSLEELLGIDTINEL